MKAWEAGYPPISQMRQGLPVWQVNSNLDNGGLLVREDVDLNSKEVGRLAGGSRIEQLDIVGNRMSYRRIDGEGPKSGWVTIMFRGVQTMRQEGPAESGLFGARLDDLHLLKNRDPGAGSGGIWLPNGQLISVGKDGWQLDQSSHLALDPISSFGPSSR
eukprot:gnl/TRDRNA2_/TRDRNA2_194729_c0_seq1.p1 gnl/TRDRNA2_/TRDRNA2_194729_c0~~gnl/TRDRNA2_/TRDRNA2_194729_c0_seq1.p1  ORF type:complete len:159 (+),score=12.96 gnl/TRDRNA2_/TRDRNA2_194729_c0_seq1:69-545(+)